jgi:hypothetical protein
MRYINYDFLPRNRQGGPMPFTQRLLVSIPIIPLVILIVLSAVLLSFLGMAAMWRFIPHHVRKNHLELTKPIFEVVAMAYTVLLAFVVVVAWQNYDKATTHVEIEANCLVDLYRSAAGFAQPHQDRARAFLKDYVHTVVDDEWPKLGRGQESLNARAALRKVWEFYTEYEPQTDKEKIFFAESLRKLDELREARRYRILDAGAQMHPVLWLILIFGGLATMGFTFFLGSESFKTHVMMASALAVLIALILFTIMLFDFPFSGSARLGPETFQQIINY